MPIKTSVSPKGGKGGSLFRWANRKVSYLWAKHAARTLSFYYFKVTWASSRSTVWIGSESAGRGEFGGRRLNDGDVSRAGEDARSLPLAPRCAARWALTARRTRRSRRGAEGPSGHAHFPFDIGVLTLGASDSGDFGLAPDQRLESMLANRASELIQRHSASHFLILTAPAVDLAGPVQNLALTLT